MDKEKYTIQDVASRLNLSKNRVRKLIANGQLQPTNPSESVVTISQSEFERYSQQLRAERLERLKEIARACEELGLYDDDIPVNDVSKSLGAAKDEFEVPDPSVELNESVAALFQYKKLD